MFWKNRIYLIPFDTVGNNKASFGDVSGLRDGSLSGDELQSKLKGLYTFDELLSFTIEAIKDPNFRCEDGVAIYGSIPNQGISFFEVERKYDLMQKKQETLV